MKFDIIGHVSRCFQNENQTPFANNLHLIITETPKNIVITGCPVICHSDYESGGRRFESCRARHFIFHAPVAQQDRASVS